MTHSDGPSVRNAEGMIVASCPHAEIADDISRALNAMPLAERIAFGLSKWQWELDVDIYDQVFPRCVCCQRSKATHDDDQCELAALLREWAALKGGEG